MRVALDVMGGYYAPATTVEGAVEALNEDKDLSVILVGYEKEIISELKKRKVLAMSEGCCGRLKGINQTPRDTSWS